MRLLPLLIIVGCVSCSLDYRPAQVGEDRSDEIPETVMVQARMVIVRSEARRFQVSAGRVAAYPRRQRQEFTAFEFREFDSDGELLSSGSADFAVYHTDSDNVDLSGNIVFYSTAQEARILADALFWNDAERLLTGEPDAVVRLERDGGTVVEGIGFSADMRTSTMEFARQVSGRLVTDE